jgi:hypothetical protein
MFATTGTDGTVGTMPGMNVPFEDNELKAINDAASAAGISARQYIKNAALDLALAKQTAFLDHAMYHYGITREAFAEAFPQDVQPNTDLRRAEADAARHLGNDAHGTAA